MNKIPRDAFVAEFAELEARERAHIAARRKQRGIDADQPRFGFALSSGGMRSAAFGLGVTRALHEKGVYERMDYLSAVGGGGFIAAFISWLRRHERKRSSSQAPAELVPDEALHFVRQRADLLNPPLGQRPAADEARAPSKATLFGVVLGQMALSLTVYASLLVGLFFLLHIGDAVVNLQKPVLLLVTRNDIWRFCVAHLNFACVAGLVVLALGAARMVGSLFGYAGRLAWEIAIPAGAAPRFRDSWRGALWLLLGLVSGALALAALSDLSEGLAAWFAAPLFGAISARCFLRCRAHWDGPAVRGRRYGSWLLLSLAGALLTAGTLLGLFGFYLFMSGDRPVGDPPVLGRAGGVVSALVAAMWLLCFAPPFVRGLARLLSDVPAQRDARANYLRSLTRQHESGAMLAWAAFWFVLGTIPWWEQAAEHALGSRLLHLHAFGAALAFVTLWTCLRVVASARRARRRRDALPTGARDALFVILLYGLLVLAHGVSDAILDSSLPQAGLLSVLVGIVLGGLSQLNFAGAGRVFKNRVTETFLPDADALTHAGWQPALEASHFPLLKLDDARDRSPYLLLNASLVTDGSANRKHGQRGSDSFVLSPLFCGSAATGWSSTRQWLGGRLSLSDALTISAAATAPGADLDTHGSSRNWAVTLGLAVLNLRPYFSADNPNPTYAPAPSRLRPNLLVPGLRSLLFGHDQSEHSRHVCLSDGKHFEALGLYELLRRKVELIVVSDATEDESLSFHAFGQSLQRAREDLGVNVVFEPGTVFGVNAGQGVYGAVSIPGVSARGFAVGSIQYGDGTPAGTLIYIKPALIDGLQVDVHSFAATHPRFPRATSPDHLFDEHYFIAYEQLGYQISLRALEEGLAREAPQYESVPPPRYDSFIQFKGAAPAKTWAG